MKVVESGYKIDLHIHSVHSRGKDKAKVSFNTIENIGVLSQKLNENGVQICAITDHDVFDYEIYRKLKECEEDNSFSIIKVFPGVEFSVIFQGDCEDVMLHVIAIFNDEDDEKIKNISSCLSNEKGAVDYDCDNAFSEEKFLSILRNINVDTILIVHQKSTLSTTRPYKHDAKTVGEERFQEFVYTDYFEAFEFKNRKNEVFNKNYLNNRNQVADIRFITGSDCHDWRCYPREDEKDKEEFAFSYVKCLPTFRGLVMAVTDHRRIKTVNSFFNPAEIFVKEIEVTIDGLEYRIPLSRGINVIIGDNSIGKSMLLHKLTGYIKQQDGLLKRGVVTGYNKYLKSNKIDVKTEISVAEIFAFDMQGEVRDKFEQGKIKSDDFLKDYYPSAIRAGAYKEKVQRQLQKIYDFLEEKFAIELKQSQLGRFDIIEEELMQAESLTFVGNVTKNNKAVEGYGNVNGDVSTVIEKIETLMQSQWLEEEDRKQFEAFVIQLKNIAIKYDCKRKQVERENTRIALFQSAINDFKQKYQVSISDSQKKLSLFNENMTMAVDSICDLIIRRKNNEVPDFFIEKECIEVSTNRVYDYEFNSRLGIAEISEEYIKGLFSAVLGKGITKSILEMTQEELADALPYFKGTHVEALDELKLRISDQLEEDFTSKFTITQAGKDRTQELSSGFNSKIYFDLLSYSNEHCGVYIIDQPEDNISQKSIREYLLDRFKVMGENRQVILVTHNPQFIVNLDVDNVIYLGKEGENMIVQSGALEYKDDNYSILDIISDHIEGGLDTLKRRWKRYDKSSTV